MSDDPRVIYMKGDNLMKRLKMEVPEAGLYLFQPDEALVMVKSILYSLGQMGYHPVVITDDRGQFVDLELIGA